MMRTTLLLAVLMLTACASHGHGTGSHATITSEEQFIAEMIPHHQEAVDTSRLVGGSTSNEEIRDLANRIITAQEQEIAMMQGWLAAWYPQSQYQSSYEPMMGDLVHASDRDQAYLEGMIEHHEAAIMMAEQVLALQPRAEVATLARDIITTQRAEIAQMQELLR